MLDLFYFILRMRFKDVCFVGDWVKMGFFVFDCVLSTIIACLFYVLCIILKFMCMFLLLLEFYKTAKMNDYGNK